MINQQRLKKWIIFAVFVLFVLFVLCATFLVTNKIFASAESFDEQISDLNNEQSQNNDESFSSSASILSSGGSTYINLGNSRHEEGDEINGKPLINLHYIENANYFLANPYHHENSKSVGDHPFGTCTTVAHQLLVGYHNYYSDRRLIPEISSDGKRYLAEDYGDLSVDPILACTPLSGECDLGRTSIGTTDEVFYGIFNLAGGSDLLSQTIGSVATASDLFLTECANGRAKNWSIVQGGYNEQFVINELDAGRPVVIGFDVFGNHSSHVIVAYGYATYDNELCYITHYGWYKSAVQMLVPASWLAYQVTMEVDHTHQYELMGQTYEGTGNDVYTAMKCSVCGCTTLVEMSTLFAGGSGTTSDPFLISNAEQFNNIRYAFRSVYVPRQGFENQINYAFELTNSIRIPGDWSPFTYKFTGDFDGNGYYISYEMDLSQTDVNESIYQGLFGFVTSGGKIHDLELMNCTIRSYIYTSVPRPDDEFINIGIVAGAFYEASSLSNIIVTNPEIACVIPNAVIGAIAGSCHGTMATGCVVREEDNGVSSIINNEHSYIGGLAGLADSVAQFRGSSVKISLTNIAFNQDTDMIGPVIGNANLSEDEYLSQYDITVDVTVDVGSCIAAGTLITLADGTQKPVEALTGDEMLLVWNLQTGQYDEAPILFIDCDALQNYSVINLSFSNGETVKVISEHGFWDYNLNEYVYLDKDAAQYIGHWFFTQATDENGNIVSDRAQLISVTITEEQTMAYSPVTYGHLCYFVNGMLSMPGGIGGLLNIFDVDAETMSYDKELMQGDIDTYGLYTYEEFNALVPIPQEVFEAFNGKYLKVAVGKGLIDISTLSELVERYSDHVALL